MKKAIPVVLVLLVIFIAFLLLHNTYVGYQYSRGVKTFESYYQHFNQDNEIGVFGSWEITYAIIYDNNKREGFMDNLARSLMDKGIPFDSLDREYFAEGKFNLYVSPDSRYSSCKPTPPVIFDTVDWAANKKSNLFFTIPCRMKAPKLKEQLIKLTSVIAPLVDVFYNDYNNQNFKYDSSCEVIFMNRDVYSFECSSKHKISPGSEADDYWQEPVLKFAIMAKKL